MVWLTGPLRTDRQTDRQTSDENNISAIHSVHLADMIANNVNSIFENDMQAIDSSNYYVLVHSIRWTKHRTKDRLCIHSVQLPSPTITM